MGIKNGKYGIVKLFFSWLFTYGLSVSTALVIYIDFIIFKSKKVFLLGIFETLFTHLTIYSRAVFISVIAYFRGYLFLLNDFKIKLNKLILIKTFTLAIAMCVVIFFAISELRNTNFKLINWIGPSASLTKNYASDLFSTRYSQLSGLRLRLKISGVQRNQRMQSSRLVRPWPTTITHPFSSFL